MKALRSRPSEATKDSLNMLVLHTGALLKGYAYHPVELRSRLVVSASYRESEVHSGLPLSLSFVVESLNYFCP